MPRSPRRSRLLAAPAALLLLIAACGDDDDDDTADTAAADVTEPAGTEPAGTEPTGTEPADTASSGTASGETYEADEYVDAMVEEIGGDEESASCVAQAMVDAVGTDRLEASGATPEEFASTGSLEDLDLAIDPSAAPTLQSDLEACPSLIDLFAEAADASDVQVDCLRENVSEAQVAELLVIQFVGGTPSQELLDAQAATQACAEE